MINKMLNSEFESLTIDYKTIALPIKLNQHININNKIKDK